MPIITYSVSDINRYVKQVLTNDPSLKFILVKGEVSNFKVGANGHLYFSLKDKDSLIGAVMFASYANHLIFAPKNGDEVVVTASVDVYPQRGTYQLLVYEMNAIGQGNILLELEKLKKQLQSEGLFDPNRKKPINLYPKAVGVITAPNGAAVRDIVINLHRRFPVVDIYVFPSQVQGESAPKELLKAFKKAQEYPLDTIIIGRGGGASEDLSAFNDETLVRAIADSKIPVIAAVGHEIDSTLVDYVADKRASTPTGAAELASVDVREIEQHFQYALEDMKNAIYQKLEDMKDVVSSHREDLYSSISNLLTNLRDKLRNKKEHLEALNPRKILKRGYSISQDQNGKVITSINEVKDDDIIITVLQDGTLTSKIKERKNR